MNIRTLKEDDIELVTKYEEEYFESSLGYDYILNDIKNNPFARYYVIDDNGFAGYISMNVDEMGEILNFFIVNDKRGKGLGRALLEYALNEAFNANAKSISLEVKETNTNAIKLYESFGFKLSHKRKGYYNGIDALMMIKEV